MRRADKIAVATRDPVLMGMLCGAIGQSDRYIAAVSNDADPAHAEQWRGKADILLIGANDLIALGRQKRRKMLSFIQSAPPLVIALRSEQLLDLAHLLDQGQGLLFCDGGLDHLVETCDLALQNMLIIPGAVWAGIRTRNLWCDRLDRMTPREMAILDLLAQARNNREIGAALGLAPHEVKTGVRAAIRKLGVGNRTAAGLFFLRYSRAATSFSRHSTRKSEEPPHSSAGWN